MCLFVFYIKLVFFYIFKFHLHLSPIFTSSTWHVYWILSMSLITNWLLPLYKTNPFCCINVRNISNLTLSNWEGLHHSYYSSSTEKTNVTRDFKDCSFQKFIVLYNPSATDVFYLQFCSPTANKLSTNGGESEQCFFFFEICVQYPWFFLIQSHWIK